MTLDLGEFFKIINTPVGTAVLLIIIGYLWLGHKLRPMVDLKKTLESIHATLVGQAKMQQAMLTILGRANLIRSSDIDLIVQAKDDVIGKVISSEVASRNPLTREQANDLQSLYDKIKRGNTLDEQEAKRLLEYAQTMSKERPNESGTWDLLALAALTLGYSTSQGPEELKGMYPPVLPDLGDDRNPETSDEPLTENPTDSERR